MVMTKQVCDISLNWPSCHDNINTQTKEVEPMETFVSDRIELSVVKVNGVKCLFTSNPSEVAGFTTAPSSYPYWYYVKHHPDKPQEPAMLEREGLVDCMGKIFCRRKLYNGSAVNSWEVISEPKPKPVCTC